MKLDKININNKDSNFELLRVVSMIFIISLHYVAHSVIILDIDDLGFNYYLMQFFRVSGPIFLNLFVMLTGYYMINKKIKIKKIIKIYLQVLFYSLSIYLIFNYKKINIKELFFVLFPIGSERYWFASTYIGLYVLIPFINKMVTQLNKEQYKILLIILTFFTVIEKNIFHSNKFFINDAFSVIWFIYLYLVSGYIRMYFNKNKNKIFYMVIILIFMMISITIRTISLIYVEKMGDRFVEYNSVFIIVPTILMFLVFKEIQIKSVFLTKIITLIAPYMFGIYLIHDNKIIRNLLWFDWLHVNEYANSPYLIIHFILSIFSVFFVGIIVEVLRVKMFDQLSNTKIIKKVSEKIDFLTYKIYDN